MAQASAASATAQGWPKITWGRMHLWWAIWMLLAAQLHLGAAQTAYVIPAMQQDNPSNHSYKRMSNIFQNEAVLQQYDVIAFVDDYRVNPVVLNDGEPAKILRNLTITSANYSTQGYRLLELEFLVQRALIPEGVSLSFKDIALGRARKTSGQGIPFFVGQGRRSQLVLDNVIRIRTACAHNEPELIQALQSIARRDRSSVRPDGKQQQVELVPTFPWRGKQYEEAIRGIDVTYFVGPVDVPDTTYYAGFSMTQLNTTRVCETYVSDECVAKKGAGACVEEQVALLTAPRSSSRSQSQQQQQANPASLAAIIAPSVVGGCLLAAAAAYGLFLILRRRRRGGSDTGSPSKGGLLPITDMGEFSTGGTRQSGYSGPDRSAEAPLGSLNMQPPYSHVQAVHAGAHGSIEDLGIGNRAGSWQLAAFHTAPEFDDATPHDKLRLGVLLGAGSFGRVYKGTWRHLDVAVKVLQHDSTTAAAISNEVDLVMSFRHPNIVAAYYFVTWSRTTAAQEAQQGVGTLEPSTAQHSPPRPAQLQGRPAQLQGPPAAAGTRGTVLEPVAEAPSSISTRQSGHTGQSGTTGHSSTAAAASSSSAGERTPRRTIRVSFDGTRVSGSLLGVAPGDVRPSSRGSSWGTGRAQGSFGCTNSTSSNAMDSSSSSSSSSANASGRVHSAPGLATAAVQMRRSPAGSSNTNMAVLDQPSPQPQQQQQQVTAIVPYMQPCSSSSVEAHAQRRLSSGSTSVSAADVRLVPYVGSVSCGDASPNAQQYIQQRPSSLPSQDSYGYAVSGPDTSHSMRKVSIRDATVGSRSYCADTSSRSCAVARDAAASCSTAAMTQSNLTASSAGSQNSQQLPLDKEVYQDQQQALQPMSQDKQQPQQQQQQQRFVPVLQGGRASPASDGDQPQACVLGNTYLSYTQSSSGKMRFRSVDEAQTWLIFEYCDSGTLLDLMLADGGLSPEVAGARRLGQVLTLLLDIASGMSYLHSRNVLHGDLKPCNVLIKHVQGAPYGRVALVSDFGLSRALQVGQSHRSTRTFGTLNHTPPELLRLGRLSPAGDVYAFGIIMWEAFSGQVAFQGLHYGEVFEQVALLQRRPEIPPDMPEDYAELVQHCWAADPLSRPSFTTVKQRLDSMLSSLLQDEAEAYERFISDL